MEQEEYWKQVIIFRCACQDWPVHRYSAYHQKARCVLCKSICEVIEELYPEEKYARNQPTYYEM